MSNQHIAAIIPSKGSQFEVVQRPTPKPGADEVLVEISSIALNPIDYYSRDFGFMVGEYPAVIGSDIAGKVVSVGSSVANPDLKPGQRIAGFAMSAYKAGKPDYGAFQKFALLPSANLSPIPDTLSDNEAAILGMAVETTFAGWYSIGLPFDTKVPAADKKGLLVWGGSSSVGSAVIQIAKLMGFSVYATASKTHHEYLKTLGATHTFDYHDADVVDQIVQAAKKEGETINIGYMAVAGALNECVDILEQVKESGEAKLASAPPLPADFEAPAGFRVAFVAVATDPAERNAHFAFVFNKWLKEKLVSGEFVPSPRVKIIAGGLEGLNKGLDELKAGVSGTKLVLEI